MAGPLHKALKEPFTSFIKLHGTGNYVTICLLAIDFIAGAKVIRLMGPAVKVPVMGADKNLENFPTLKISTLRN